MNGLGPLDELPSAERSPCLMLDVFMTAKCTVPYIVLCFDEKGHDVRLGVLTEWSRDVGEME